MTIYLFDTDQEMMDACEWLLNAGKEITRMYPANPNFWCLECEGWCAFPLKHSNLTGHNIARAEPRRRK